MAAPAEPAVTMGGREAVVEGLGQEHTVAIGAVAVVAPTVVGRVEHSVGTVAHAVKAAVPRAVQTAGFVVETRGAEENEEACWVGDGAPFLV